MPGCFYRASSPIIFQKTVDKVLKSLDNNSIENSGIKSVTLEIVCNIFKKVV